MADVRKPARDGFTLALVFMVGLFAGVLVGAVGGMQIGRNQAQTLANTVVALAPSATPATTPTLAFAPLPTTVAASTVAATPGSASVAPAATLTLAPTAVAAGPTRPAATAASPTRPATTAVSTVSATAAPKAMTSAEAMALQMLDQVNAARAKSPPITPQFSQGVTPAQPKPVVFDEQLAKVAEAHARDMATRTYLAHNSPEGKNPADRIKDAGIAFELANENIYQAFGDDALKQAMDWFLQDQLHRDVILDPRYTRLGVGVFVVDNKYYFVQKFIQAP